MFNPFKGAGKKEFTHFYKISFSCAGKFTYTLILFALILLAVI